MLTWNREKGKKSVLLLALFVVFTALVKLVDVRPIGPMESSVGFGAVNGAVASLLGFRQGWFTCAEILGYVALFYCLVFAALGLRQLVAARGHIRQVDGSYLALGLTYLITLACYVLFNLVVVNYRPVILPGEGTLEASYPSSHTVLAVVVMLTAAIMFRRILPRGDRRKPVLIGATYLLMILAVLSRLLSGAHWVTDIAGGLILAAFLVSLFDAMLGSASSSAASSKKAEGRAR